jgi:hypothetical protein
MNEKTLKIRIMKKLFSIYTMVCLLVSVFSSCEKGIETVEYESTVYIPNAGLSTQSVLLGESVFELGIYRAGINSGEGEVTVTLKIDNAAFSEFQSSNPGYELLPESYYTLETPTVTIAEGDERSICKIHMKGIDENFVSKNYILPISIESVSPEVAIPEESQTALLSFSSYRSVYECKYKAFGTVTAEGEESANSAIDEEIIAETVSPNTIKLKGAESNMYIKLTVSDDGVTISGASGSEAYDVQNTAGKTSTYTGAFNPVYQSNEGVFELYYSYMLNGVLMNAVVELKFWL